MKKDDINCSFCGKSRLAVKKIVAGPSVYICDECVSVCVEILNNDDPKWVEQFLNLDKETETNIVREVTLPPQYHQVGLSLIGYFSIVIKYKYPDTPITTRIEQDGRLVRLVIRTGKEPKEQFRQLLNDYALVIQGKLLPEQFFKQPEQVEELKKRLRITELELRRLVAGDENADSTGVNEKVAKLHTALGWIMSEEIEDLEELFA